MSGEFINKTFLGCGLIGREFCFTEAVTPAFVSLQHSECSLLSENRRITFITFQVLSLFLRRNISRYYINYINYRVTLKVALVISWIVCLSVYGLICDYYICDHTTLGFPGGASGKEPACQCRRHKRHRFDPWVRKILWRRDWQHTPVFLPRESMDRGTCQAIVQRVVVSQRVGHYFKTSPLLFCPKM